MSAVMSRNFNSPDELRTPANAQVAVVAIGDTKVAQLRLEPGWRWSESVKPVVGTDTCQARHVGVLISGAMQVLGSDGTESGITPGMAYVIEPGHDAWVTGSEAVIAYEFDRDTAATYATSSE
jgi:hypothetical protein